VQPEFGDVDKVGDAEERIGGGIEVGVGYRTARGALIVGAQMEEIG
jgi:hypothetical protein